VIIVIPVNYISCIMCVYIRVTNSPLFPGHVLFSRPVLAVFYKVMKMSCLFKKKNILGKISSTAKYRWVNKEDEEEKQDKEEEN